VQKWLFSQCASLFAEIIQLITSLKTGFSNRVVSHKKLIDHNRLFFSHSIVIGQFFMVYVFMVL